MHQFTIGRRVIGSGAPCYIVAEISANHNQQFERVLALIHAAKSAGADAVKAQTYTADTLTIDSDREWFQIRGDGPWAGKTLHGLYQEAYTPWEWHERMRDETHALGMDFFSTPFDPTAVEFLEKLGVAAYKVASFEVVDLPLLRRIGATKKPVIMSVGMATEQEIEEALGALRSSGTPQLALLKCTSAYPAPPSEMNLRTIPWLAERFGVVAGLSDHTLGSAVATAAVAVGAVIVEKHLTLARADGGPDAGFSMEPAEFGQMVRDIRTVELALGRVSIERTPEESRNVPFRRSLFVVRDMKAGEPFTRDNVRSIRPGHGLMPKHFDEVVGRRSRVAIERGTPLAWDLIE